LCLFPDWFGPMQPDWPPQTVHAGFPLWDERTLTPMAAEVEAFLQAGDRPIAFTPGSAMLHGQEFFQAAVEACERLGRRGILLTRHAEQLPKNLPTSVRHFGFVPLSQLLPRASAIVHHAGIGTVGQGLAAGVPHVSMAMAHDQFDNAARLERLGVSETISVKRLNGGNLAGTLGRLLQSPLVAERCRELTEQVKKNDSLGAACGELERIVATVRSRAAKSSFDACGSRAS
jgi:rhamnosyltransferase subunit B